jgi:hypothetical protein
VEGGAVDLFQGEVGQMLVGAILRLLMVPRAVEAVVRAMVLPVVIRAGPEAILSRANLAALPGRWITMGEVLLGIPEVEASGIFIVDQASILMVSVDGIVVHNKTIEDLSMKVSTRGTKVEIISTIVE